MNPKALTSPYRMQKSHPIGPATKSVVDIDGKTMNLTELMFVWDQAVLKSNVSKHQGGNSCTRHSRPEQSNARREDESHLLVSKQDIICLCTTRCIAAVKPEIHSGALII